MNYNQLIARGHNAHAANRNEPMIVAISLSLISVIIVEIKRRLHSEYILCGLMNNLQKHLAMILKGYFSACFKRS